MITMKTATPRAWVGCLACYNNGTLRGEWVEGIEAGDCVPCVGRGHEEFWVMDHENYGGALRGECSPIEAQEIAEQLAEIEEDQREAFEALLGDQNLSSSWTLSDVVEMFERQYRGTVEVETTFEGYSREVCALAESLEDCFPESELPGWAREAWWQIVLYKAQGEYDSGSFSVLRTESGDYAIFDNAA